MVITWETSISLSSFNSADPPSLPRPPTHFRSGVGGLLYCILCSATDPSFANRTYRFMMWRLHLIWVHVAFGTFHALFSSHALSTLYLLCWGSTSFPPCLSSSQSSLLPPSCMVDCVDAGVPNVWGASQVKEHLEPVTTEHLELSSIKSTLSRLLLLKGLRHPVVPTCTGAD